MPTGTAPVSGDGNPAGVEPAAAGTTPNGAGVAQTTPSNAPRDARQTGQAGSASSPEVAALQRDINRIKSTFQSQLAAQERQHQAALQALQTRLREAETRGMTDEQRQQYEQATRQDQLQQIYAENQRLQQQLVEQEQRQAYVAHYTNMGIPLESLTVDGSIDELVASGWQAVQAEIARLKGGGQPASPAAPVTPETVTPPEVVTATSAPARGATWQELETSLNMTSEEIYRAVETGQLSPDIIPVPKQ